MSNGAPGALQIHLLGPPHMSCNGKPLRPLSIKKGYWLLALLILHRKAPLQRKWLAETLWPDSEFTDQTYGRLRTTLCRLRSSLGDEKWRLQSATDDTLWLDLTDTEVDVLSFDRAIARGDMEALKTAVGLYAGPLLEGFPEEWLLPERVKREQEYFQAIEAVAAKWIEEGEFVTAARVLRVAAARGLFEENIHRLLMEALARSGSLTEALEVYKALNARLYSEHNTAPNSETTSLYSQLRAQQTPARKPTRSTAASQRSQTHPLLYRVPHPLTTLIGRGPETKEIRALLESERLVTLIGTGGVGKTRLAIHVARQMEAEFSDGVCFVSLETLPEGTDVHQRVLAGLLALEEFEGLRARSVVNLLASRNMLLVLDNCEQLIGACAKLAGEILRGCPEICILATSRERLGPIGEICWDVSPLVAPEPNTHPDLSRLTEFSAMLLFQQRAAAVRKRFTITQANFEIVATICRRLDGIPFAIELAAALYATQSVAAIAEGLDDRFHHLIGTDKSAPKRHQTLRSMVDWSYDLLEGQEKVLLERLSLFSGGWTLEAAKAVCGDEKIKERDIPNLLSRLGSKSLVVVEECEGDSRYRLLETIRQYAHEKVVEQPLRNTFEMKLCTYYAEWAKTAERNLHGNELSLWLARFEQEHDNLRASLTLCTSEPSLTETGLILSNATCRFWQMRGYYQEGRDWLGRILKVASEKLSPSRTLIEAHRGMGNLAYGQGIFPEAQSLFRRALDLANTQNERRETAAALGSLANVATDIGDLGTAKSLFEEALVYFRELKDKSWVGATLGNLGVTACRLEDYPLACKYHEEVILQFRTDCDYNNLPISLNNLADVRLKMDQFDVVPKLLVESVALSLAHGNQRGLFQALILLCTLTVKEQRFERGAVLIGIIEALQASFRFPLSDKAKADFSRDCDTISRSLDITMFEAAHSFGKCMPADRILKFVSDPDAP